MEGICNRLAPRCVLLDVQEQDLKQIIRTMVTALTAEVPVSDPDRLVREVMAREQLSSTCIGNGCAIPHAHSDTVHTSLIVAARLATAVTLDTPDGLPVSLVFLLVGPARRAMAHLKLLSKLARILHDEESRKSLRAATSADEFLGAICKGEMNG